MKKRQSGAAARVYQRSTHNVVSADTNLVSMRQDSSLQYKQPKVAPTSLLIDLRSKPKTTICTVLRVHQSRWRSFSFRLLGYFRLFLVRQRTSGDSDKASSALRGRGGEEFHTSTEIHRMYPASASIDINQTAEFWSILARSMKQSATIPCTITICNRTLSNKIWKRTSLDNDKVTRTRFGADVLFLWLRCPDLLA